MKKLLVVGAGAQGAPCASILARGRDVEKIVLADVDLDVANKVRDKIKSSKITTMKIDVEKIEDLDRGAKEVDVVINLTLPRLNANIMKAALRNGAHYVDTAFDEPIWPQIIEKQPLEFDNEFKKAGLTALIACGGSPGITNVLTRYICDKLDRVDEIMIRVGNKSLKESKEPVKGWEPDWCPEIALMGYSFEPPIFEDGAYKHYPPFSECEEYDFPAPTGSVLLCYQAHEEAVTLPHFIGKGVKYVGFKYPVDMLAGAFIKMGFANSEPIDVKGVKVVARDVILGLVHHPVDFFLAEDENSARLPPESANPCVIEVKGEKSGENVKYIISWPLSLFTSTEEKLAFYRRFGATNIGTALPAIVGAKMCVEGEAGKGIIAPECLEPTKFLKVMAKMGAPVKFSEVLSKEIAIL
ncbi:MAG: saccharopine dehydrogenase NADP-binding domain-containing protein [Dehalococcoidia bacterium]|nr:saccharopine dehydrogenase NADP-binding domain-containing protein [Dehalococcoidia bacterium]